MVRIVNKQNKKNTKTTKKTNDEEMLSCTEVGYMLCKLGFGIAKHFDIDETEVIEYLDGVCEDTIGVNPNSAQVFNNMKEHLYDDEEEDDEEEDDSDILTIKQSELDEWFAPGGLSLKALRKKALDYGIEPEGLKKSDIKVAMEELVVPDEDEEEEDDEGEEADITVDMIEGWFATPSKGGLKLADLKAKAEEFGIDTDGLKKKDLKEALMALCNGEEEEENDESEESEESGSPSLSKDQVLIWCVPPGKGGLKLNELKDKASEYGIETKGLKKADLKEALMALCEDEEGEDDESENADTFDCYMEADGAKGKKFWSCKVVGCELTTSFGSVGKDGHDTVRELVTNEKAVTQAKKLVLQKVAKGYDCIGNKKKKRTVEIKSSTTGQCHYKNRSGKECSIKPKGSAKFCAKHSTGHKSSKSTPTIVRNKEAKVWMVEGEKLIVKSPKNPTVYAFLSKNGSVNKKLTSALKVHAQELGLEVTV